MKNIKEMEIIRSYTTIEQSHKLAEILPIESADMWWAERYTGRVENYEYIVEKKPVYYLSFTKPSEENYSQDTIKDIPCWSLAALLDVFPDELTDSDGGVYRIDFFHLKGKYIIQYPKLTTLWPSLFSAEADNSVDACYEMILKLKEKKLL